MGQKFPRTLNATLCDQSQLFFEDGEHGFAFGTIDLGESGLNDFAIVGAAVVEELREAEGRVTQEDFCVLEALVVVGHAEVEFFGQVLDLLEQVSSLVGIASGILLHTVLGHLMDELGVKEALFAGLSGGNSCFEGGDALLVDGLIVGGRCEGGQNRRRDSEHDDRASFRPHEEPPLSGIRAKLQFLQPCSKAHQILSLVEKVKKPGNRVSPTLKGAYISRGSEQTIGATRENAQVETVTF